MPKLDDIDYLDVTFRIPSPANFGDGSLNGAVTDNLGNRREVVFSAAEAAHLVVPVFAAVARVLMIKTSTKAKI